MIYFYCNRATEIECGKYSYFLGLHICSAFIRCFVARPSLLESKLQVQMK